MAGETGSDDVDPWAPGGSMSAPGGDLAPIPLSFDAVDDATRHRPARGKQFIVGAIAAASLAAASSVVVTSDRGDDDDRPAASTALPPASTAASTQSTSAGDEPPNPPGLSIRPSFPGEAMTFVGAHADDVITIARDLREIAPTQIVGLHDDLGLYELSLPSGLLRITDLGFGPTDARLTANDGAGIVWPTPEGGYHVIGADGSSTTFAAFTAALRAVGSNPGSDRMYLWTSGQGDRAIQTLDVVDGGFEVSPTDWVDRDDATPAPIGPDGSLLQADTGGTYRITEDGADLLTTGDVIAVGRNHVLLRECLPDRTCALITLGSDGSRTSWGLDLPDRANPQSVSGLAPSGDAVLIAGDRFSADTPRVLQVLDLVDGSITGLRASPEFSGVGSWASDSSGVFFADAQLLFIDRRTGETIVVSEELPAGLRDIDTRLPVQTPICELLSITQPRFDSMRAAADDSVLPPAIDVLTRIVEIGPSDLSGAAQPLVTFIGTFVSRSTRGSLTVSNWPAEEREGLDALDSYFMNECMPI